jgi:putative MFS transporter
LSQRLRSRKRAVLVFLALTALGIGLFFTVGRTSLAAFYASCCVLGFGAGYWAVFVTVASEQFGTNVRATATTTAPNFVRGSVVLLTTAFEWLAPRRGPVGAALVLGGVVMGLAFVALASLGETYGKDLDFHER